MSTAAAAATGSSQEHIDARIVDIDRGDNYRKTYDEKKLAELGESIAASGVVQPVVIRPGLPGGKPWRLIIGERRVRASLAVGKATIPAIVRRDLDDAAARAISIVENLQREGVDPLEEADGFRELHEKMGWPVDKIAERVGQKRGYVYARLKLCQLGPEGRKAYHGGVIDVSSAVAIARIPTKESQAAAIKRITQHGGAVTYQQVVRIVHEEFMRRLQDAPFDTASETLLPEAGSCTKCPKRTGNQRELFADVKSADVCTDPPCFKKKADAAWAVTAADAEKKGAKILDDSASKKLFPYADNLAHGTPYVDLGEQCYSDDKRRTFGKLVAKGTPVVLVRDQLGGVHKLVERKLLDEAIKGSGVKLASYESSKRGAGDAEKKQREASDKKRAVVRAIIDDIVKKATPVTPMLRALVDTLARAGFSDAIAQVVARRGWTVRGENKGTTFGKRLDELTQPALFAMLVEVIVSREGYWQYASGLSDSIKSTAKACGVDYKGIEKRALAGLAEAKKAKAPAAKKKGGRK